MIKLIGFSTLLLAAGVVGCSQKTTDQFSQTSADGATVDPTKDPNMPRQQVSFVNRILKGGKKATWTGVGEVYKDAKLIDKDQPCTVDVEDLGSVFKGSFDDRIKLTVSVGGLLNKKTAVSEVEYYGRVSFEDHEHFYHILPASRMGNCLTNNSASSDFPGDGATVLKSGEPFVKVYPCGDNGYKTGLYLKCANINLEKKYEVF